MDKRNQNQPVKKQHSSPLTRVDPAQLENNQNTGGRANIPKNDNLSAHNPKTGGKREVGEAPLDRYYNEKGL